MCMHACVSVCAGVVRDLQTCSRSSCGAPPRTDAAPEPP